MPKMLEVDANELIEKAAAELGKDAAIKAPEWAKYAKTGRHKERVPVRSDWWQVRAAAVLRSVAKLGPVGVEKLRTKYGGKKNRGHKTEHHYKGSGSVIRKVLQQLAKAELVREGMTGAHKGRMITKKAADMLNRIASEISGTGKSRESPAKETPKHAEKSK